MATKKRKEATDFLLSLGADEEASDEVLTRTMSTNLRPPAPPRSLARKQSDNQEAAVDLIEDDTPVNLEPRGGRGSSMIIDGVDYRKPQDPPSRPALRSVTNQALQSMGDSSDLLDGRQVVIDEKPILTYLENRDPFGVLGLSDPQAIAAAQANDIDLKVDQDLVISEIKQDELRLKENLETKLEQLDILISDLQSQKLGYPVGITRLERKNYQDRLLKLQQDIQSAKSEYRKTKNMLSILMDEIKSSDSRVQDDVEIEKTVVDQGPVYGDRDYEREQEKLLQAETGERTLSRFFRDDLVGNISEQAFNLPVKRESSVPLASGEDAVFTRSRAVQREEDDPFPIPMLTAPETLRGAGTMIGRLGRGVAEGTMSQILSGEPVPAPYLTEENVNRGGILSTPKQSQLTAREVVEGRGEYDANRTKMAIDSRKELILANQVEINRLQKEIEDRKPGSRIADLTGRISLLQDDNEQKQAELVQLQRIRRSFE